MGLQVRRTRTTLAALCCLISTLVTTLAPGQSVAMGVGRVAAHVSVRAAPAPLTHPTDTRAAMWRAQSTLRGPSTPGGALGSLYESFANSTPDNTGWVIGGAATLTSGTTDGATGATDPSGAGWLRLTSESTTNSVGYAYYNAPLMLTNGLIVSFDYACWGGHYGPYPNNGSDGASFYLFDGGVPFSPGGVGGSLGYKGMAGAYVGVGLDEFGNFSGGYFQQEHISIAGSASAGYPILTTTAAGAISPSLCNVTGTRRPSGFGAAYQHYVIAITPDLRVTVAAYTPNSSQVYIDRYNLKAAPGQATLPATLKFGFAGATGGATDAHELRNVSVSGIGPSTSEVMCGCNQSENLGTGVRSYTHNPVTLPTGDFYHAFTDVSIPGRGAPLRFTRTYNSLLAGQNGPLGYGWSSDRTASLSTDASGAVTVTQEDGSTLPFSLTAPATYQAPSRVLATLVANGNGTLTLTRKTQEKLTFTAPTTATAGLLIAQADRNGYTTSLTYTTPLTTPLLSRVTDAAGRSLIFSYDGSNHITKISDPIGRTTVFTYDNGTGDLIAAQDVGGAVTRFTYAPGTHLLQTMTDPNNGTVTNAYDSYGRVISQTDAQQRTTTFTYAFAPGGPAQTATITDPRGYATVDQYQGNELVSETKGAGTAQAATWTYTYDPATLGVASATDPNGHTAYSAYDASGNLTSHIDALGRVTSYAYDALNDVTAITDPLGLVTTNTYDANGNLLSVSRPLTGTTQSGSSARIMSASTIMRATTASYGRTATSRDALSSAVVTATATATSAPSRAAPVAPTAVPHASKATATATATAMSNASKKGQTPTATPTGLAPAIVCPQSGGSCGCNSIIIETCPTPTDPPVIPTNTPTPTSTPTGPALAASYSSNPPTSWTAGQTQIYQVTVTNTGAQTWNAGGSNPVHLGVHFGTSSDGIGDGWSTDQRFTLTSDVPPGGAQTLTVAVIAPTTSGAYVLRARMVKEAVAWFDQIQKTNVAVASPPSGVIPIQNNGFEAPPLGGGHQYNPSGAFWAFNGGSPNGSGITGNGSAFTNSNPNAPEANQVAFLQGTGSFQQSVGPFQAGTSYVLSFAAAQRGNCCGNGGQDLQVLLDGAVLGTFKPTGTSYTTYTTGMFTTTAGTHTLTFAGLDTAGGDNTAFIDNVRVTGATPPTATPTPPSLPPTNTATPTPSPTNTASPTSTSTSTPIPPATSTAVPTATATSTSTSTATPSPTSTRTSTPIPATNTATATPTSTSTPTSTTPATATSIPSATPSATGTATPTPATGCPTASPYTATTCLTYDAARPGDVVARTDPDGHTARYAYDAYGNLVRSSDALGRATTYGYDLIGRMISKVSPNGNVAGANPLSDTTTMSYDALGETTAITDPRGGVTTYQYDPNQNLVRSTDANHHTTAYGYDADNERTTTTRPDGATLATGYDANGNVITATDALSRITTYSYDALNRRVGVIDPLNRTTANSYDLAGNRVGMTDPLGRTTVYTYDAANQQIAVRQPDGGVLGAQYDLDGQVITRTDALGHRTGDAYDSLHRLIGVTDPLNRTTTYGYDLAGNRTSMADPRGNTTAYGYDAANERITTTRADGGVWRVAYDADGNPVARTDPRNNTTTDAYDALDRLVATTDALAHTTTYQYDPVGNRTRATDANTHATAYQYDTLDRLITTTDALSHTTVYGYDAVGNRTSVVDANGHATRYGYDAGDEQTTITRTDGTTATIGYDLAGNVITRTNGLGHATTYGYDPLDRPITVTDPLTGTTVYSYDLAGNRTLLADPLGRTTVYTYDAADQQTAVGQADGSTLTTAYDAAGNPVTATDALGKQTVYGYDNLNRVITTTDPLGHQTLSGYDLAGNRTSRTDALGRVTTYGYDPLDRTAAITYSDGATPNVRYTYTATGQRRSMTDGTGATSYGYDALDRVITTTTGAGRSVGYGYDAVGNTVAITYPDGSQVTRAYDTLDRLSSVRDWLSHTARFGYNAADNLITQTLPTSTTTSIGMGYDAAERLTGITDTTPLTSWAYAYSRDKAGEIVGAVDPLDGKAHTYSYDKLAGLIGDSQGSSGITSTATWANDAAREVTQRLDPSGPYTSTLTYDNAHELTGTTTLSGTATLHNLSFLYNKNGDRTSQTDSAGGASRNFGYDQADRLITATTGITQASYSYDGDGLRQSKTITTTQGMTTTAETWDTAEGLPALLQDGATRYIAGPDGLPIEQVNPDGSIQYYLRDQLGSTRALLDGAGHTVATYSYDAYGNPTGRAGNTTTPFGYAGAYTDAETGLQYLQARYYDPAIQQFMSVDPLVDQTGQPYAYAMVDPLNMVDPTGLDSGCNGASGQDFWARAASSIGDLGCNLGEVKDFALTRRANGTTTGLVVGGGSLIFGTPTVAGGPSSPCDFAAYDAQAERDQQMLDREAGDAAVVSTALGAPSVARGVIGLAGALRGVGVSGLRAAAGRGARAYWDSVRDPGSLGIVYRSRRAARARPGQQSLFPAEVPSVPADGTGVGATTGSTAATINGNDFHYDMLNGGAGQGGPSQLQARYPDTTFDFTANGQPGVDVAYKEGTHPSEYPGSKWPAGYNHGDFKPQGPGSYGWKTFMQDMRAGKRPLDTIYIPYDPASNALLDQEYYKTFAPFTRLKRR